MLPRILLISLLLALPAFVSYADNHDPPRISTAQVMSAMSSGEEISFLDTRTKSDWDSSSIKIPGAVHIHNNESLAEAVKELTKDNLIVTYCT